MNKYFYSAAVTALLCGASPLQAQLSSGAPDSGVSLQILESRSLTLPSKDSSVLDTEVLPSSTANAASDVQIPVQQFHIQGNTLFDSQTLLTRLEDLQGRDLTLAELYQAADRITVFYRDQGYLLSRAYLPAQEIGDDGQVIIAILEGRYGSVTLDNQGRVNDRVPQALLSGLASGDVVETKALERRALLLNDLPGTRANASLSAGAAVGESNFTVRLDDEPRVRSTSTVDNYGNRHTGQIRLGTQLDIASPLGIGDAVSLNLLLSDEDQLYYQARYDLPVSAWGTRAGVSASKMDYELAGDFEALEAVGTATTVGLFVTHPWIRSRNLNVNTHLQFDRKSLEDELFDGFFVTERKAKNVTLGVSGDWRDGFGGGSVNAFSASWVQGRIKGDVPESGSFGKLQVSLLRLQRLGDRFSLYTALQGQTTGDNLDSSEKLSLGGAYGVRAYPSGEASADEGAIVNVELRYQWQPEWQLMMFADGGYARLVRQPNQPGDYHRNLSGAGFGVNWQALDRLHIGATAAWRTGERPVSDKERSPHAWVRAEWRF